MPGALPLHALLTAALLFGAPVIDAPGSGRVPPPPLMDNPRIVMDRSITVGAAMVLDFIGAIEAPRGYGTIYANGQDKLKSDITTWTLDKVEAEQPFWRKMFGSSAAGRYQFMRDTLDKPGTVQDIEGEMGLTGREIFTPDLQDRMAMHLLRRRGWDAFVAGRMSLIAFGLSLAKEWASLPVLADAKGNSRQVTRGESYYAGDGRNKSLTKADAFADVLAKALAAERNASVPVIEAGAPKPQVCATCKRPLAAA